ncbi:MAG: hypothetical protein PHF29_06055 [Candidatus Riflebacteria bacterium]|nr:hypothetical protein [Candidatus Riflebacteria bacterium]
MKKIIIVLIYILAAAIGFWFGLYNTNTPRKVETRRIEECLTIYINYKKDLDQEQLQKSLEALALTPKDFQIIIDRFIYYRSNRSGLKQALKILELFRKGANLQIGKVETVTGMKEEPFRLDAEILAVFETNPMLVEEAFQT